MRRTGILFNSFQAFNELPTQMMGRPILWKQVNYAFYRPAALSVAAQLADAPFNIVQIFIFSVRPPHCGPKCDLVEVL